MNLDEYIKEKYPKGLSYEFTPEEETGYLAAIEDVKKALSIANVVGQSEQLVCRDCKYDKAETYHDKMWCRDCRQKDRFKAK